MKKLAVRIIIFIIMIVILVILNMMVFRSPYPTLWFITSTLSVIGLICFPYKKYFK